MTYTKKMPQIFLIFSFLIISGCSVLHTEIDKKELTRNSYKDLTTPDKQDFENNGACKKKNLNPDNPSDKKKNLYDMFLKDLSENQQEDEPFEPFLPNESSRPDYKNLHKNFLKKINVAFSDSVPIKDVFSQLTTQAQVSLVFLVDTDKKITFSCVDKQVIDIIHDITKACNLRYTIHENSVIIEENSQYFKIYDIQYLNIIRESNNSMSIATDIFNNSQSSNENNDNNSNAKNILSGHENGSQSVITNSSKSDYWEELKQTLAIITQNREGAFSINKQAGLLTVHATDKEHKLIQKYIKYLKYLSQNQVVIEAKILEIKLKDDYKNGIDWGIFNKRIDVNNFNQVNSLSPINASENGGDFFSTGNFNVDGNKQSIFLLNTANFNLISNFMEKFGSVKTLSSPRITVLNNHSAIFKVAKNEVIYYPEFHRQNPTINDNRSTEVFSTSIKTIPIGLVMSVHPVIDKKSGDIILHIRPTISRTDGTKKIPVMYYNPNTNSGNEGSGGGANNGGNGGGIGNKVGGGGNKNNNVQYTLQEIPIVEVREMDSILKVKPNQTIVMGGLMQEKNISDTDGILALDKKIIGDVFNKKNKNTELTELIIFLRVKLVNNKNAVYNVDKKIYNKYANDARPLWDEVAK